MKVTTTFARLYREQARDGAVRRMGRRQWRYPLSLELAYARALKRYLRARWKKFAEESLSMYQEPVRMDAVDDILPEDPSRNPSLGAIITLAKDMDEFNRKEMDAFKAIAVGTAFSEEEPWTAQVIDDWAQRQLTLISKASTDMERSISIRIRDGVRNGRPLDAVRKAIMGDLPGISARRASVIARDQTAKLNSRLSQGRMEQAGLETYIWSTAMDERVRGMPGGRYPYAVPSHYVMEGKVCRWDNPGVYMNAAGEWVSRPLDAPTVHPGEAVMCRCVALPNWRELDEVEEATPEERALSELEAAEDALKRAETAASYVGKDSPSYSTFQTAVQEAKEALERLKK